MQESTAAGCFCACKKFCARYIPFCFQDLKTTQLTFVFIKACNMKIIIVGSTGTIGKKVAEELSKRHEVISASRTNADIKVNIESPASVETMYKKIGKFDAVISATGEGYFGPLKNATDNDFRKG